MCYGRQRGSNLGLIVRVHIHHNSWRWLICIETTCSMSIECSGLLMEHLTRVICIASDVMAAPVLTATESIAFSQATCTLPRCKCKNAYQFWATDTGGRPWCGCVCLHRMKSCRHVDRDVKQSERRSVHINLANVQSATDLVRASAEGDRKIHLLATS